MVSWGTGGGVMLSAEYSIELLEIGSLLGCGGRFSVAGEEVGDGRLLWRPTLVPA